MRRTLIVCIVLALMMPVQSFADEIAVTGSEQTEPAKRKYKDKKDEKKGKYKGEKDNGTVLPDSVEALEADDDDDDGFLMDVLGICFIGIAIGSIGSWYRVTGQPTDWDLEGAWGRREPGDPGIPYASLNFSFEGVRFSDINAFDTRFDGGYGPFGVQTRFTRFEDKDSDTQLDVSWLHGVLRNSYSQYFELGLAFGAVNLDGISGDDSGFSFGIPMRVAPMRFVSLEYRPVWGYLDESTVIDQDLVLSVGVRYVSLRGGYRWTKVQGTNLEGPNIGLLLHW